MSSRAISRFINAPLDRLNLHVSKRSTFSDLLDQSTSLTDAVAGLRLRELAHQQTMEEQRAEIQRLHQALEQQRAEIQRLRADLRDLRVRHAKPDAGIVRELGHAGRLSRYDQTKPDGNAPLFLEPVPEPRVEDCYFYHTMELPGLGALPGPWDLRGKFDPYIGHVELQDKTVLDVGSASGFLTFEAEKRGARVVSFDLLDARSQHLLPFHHKDYYVNHGAWAREQTAFYDRMKNSYWLGHHRLGSRARVHYGDIYQLPAALGSFDVVLVGSVLEHLRDPISALASISRVTAGRMIINTPFVTSEEPMAQFLPRADNSEADYSWWYFSLGTYREVFGMLGFAIESITWDKYLIAYQDHWSPRATMIVRRIG